MNEIQERHNCKTCKFLNWAIVDNTWLPQCLKHFTEMDGRYYYYLATYCCSEYLRQRDEDKRPQMRGKIYHHEYDCPDISGSVLRDSLPKFEIPIKTLEDDYKPCEKCVKEEKDD